MTKDELEAEVAAQAERIAALETALENASKDDSAALADRIAALEQKIYGNHTV